MRPGAPARAGAGRSGPPGRGGPRCAGRRSSGGCRRSDRRAGACSRRRGRPCGVVPNCRALCRFRCVVLCRVPVRERRANVVAEIASPSRPFAPADGGVLAVEGAPRALGEDDGGGCGCAGLGALGGRRVVAGGLERVREAGEGVDVRVACG